MKIGMMNNPAFPIVEEIRWAAENNFDFIDLTMEPPGGLISRDALDTTLHLLKDTGLDVVGHTAWYLPLDSPFSAVRRAVQTEMSDQLDIFHRLGAEKVTIHLIFSYPHRFFTFHQKLDLWEAALEPLTTAARRIGVKIMLENTGNSNEDMRLMARLLSTFPDIMFHLDVGHTNLNTASNRTPEYLKQFGKRLHHVHLSDNFGGSQDLHLPVGAGTIAWKRILTAIRKAGYDDTFTLEVFSPDRRYLLLSRDIFRHHWRDTGGS